MIKGSQKWKSDFTLGRDVAEACGESLQDRPWSFYVFFLSISSFPLLALPMVQAKHFLLNPV
jgi:hypothetical protein